MLWRPKLLLFKPEVTYGTDPTPTGAANAIVPRNLKISPFEGQDQDRDLETPWFGNTGTIPLDAFVKLTFETELQASGAAGTAPGWGPIALACGMAQTISAGVSVTYSPTDSNHGSGTAYFNVDGMLFAVLGCRGNVKIDLNAQGIPVMMWELTGLYQAPTNAAMGTPTYTGFPDPVGATRVNTPVFTVNSVALPMKAFSLDAGNKIENRFLINSHEVKIVDAVQKCEFTVETPALATFNPWALAEAGTLVPLALQHGVAAGRRVTVNVPQLQIQRPADFGPDQGLVQQKINAIPRRTSATPAWSIVLT